MTPRPGRSDLPRTDTPARLRAAARKVGQATAERNRLIAARRAEGAALRDIAADAGITHSAVAKIIRQADQSTSSPADPAYTGC